jgi:SAM-dependent methyltransferase
MEKTTDPNILETRGWIERIVSDHNFKSLEDLLNYINGKRILDLGSGGGGFAVDHEAIKSVFPKYTGEIYSVNPRLPNPDHSEYHKYDIGFTNYRQLAPGMRVTDTQEVLRTARETYEKKAVAASWEFLPFQANSFDAIIATGSYFFYEGTYSFQSFEEILRILKPKGDFFCSLFFSGDDQRSEFESGLSELVSSHPSIESFDYEIVSSRDDIKLTRTVYSAHIIFHKQ